MSSLIFYNPEMNSLILLEPNIGEYWMNFRVCGINAPEGYNKARQLLTIELSFEYLGSRGWELVGEM